MLRINLLPFRHLQKRAAAVNRLVLAALTIFGVILILLVVSTIKSSIANNIRSDIAALNRIKKANAHILADIKSLEKKKKELQRPISVIEKLASLYKSLGRYTEAEPLYKFLKSE